MPDEIYKPLSRPLIYRAAQWLLAPGAMPVIENRLRRLLAELPAADSLLDVGCGPASLLFRIGLCPAGLDLNPNYLAQYVHSGAPAVVGSAVHLPFADETFDGVWSIGLIHHLPEEPAKQAIREMWRVTKKGGYVAIMDGLMPSPLQHPIASAIRKMDRGRFMRRRQNFADLFPDPQTWGQQSFFYGLTRLEMAVWTKIKK